MCWCLGELACIYYLPHGSLSLSATPSVAYMRHTNKYVLFQAAPPGGACNVFPTGAEQGCEVSPRFGSDILIVEFQAYIVFVMYRIIFAANIAQISSFGKYRDMSRYVAIYACEN